MKRFKDSLRIGARPTSPHKRLRSFLSPLLCISFTISALGLTVLSPLVSVAQDSEPWKRLEQDKQGKNKFRGGEDVGSAQAAQQNMKKLFDKVIIAGEGDGKADKWYSPHLRDIWFNQENRQSEAVNTRGQAIPMDFMAIHCLIPGPPIEASCPLLTIFGTERCVWHGERFGPHRPIESCFQRNSLIYKRFTTDSNFKACCVRAPHRAFTSEQIVSQHPDGDGWAGLFEYYFPVNAVGWENDRTTTMIVEKNKVKECRDKAQAIMHGEPAVEWVSNAIERSEKFAFEGVQGAGGAGAEGATANKVRQQVRQDIKEIDQLMKQGNNEDLQMTDSLSNVGLTVRVNLATMDPVYRKTAARRFCMHPAQFDKLMDARPGDNLMGIGDPTQYPGRGGPTLQGLIDLPIWSNYCEEGATLMTDPNKSSEVQNFDRTPTSFPKGMDAWKEDPRYCQQMNLENPNINKIGFNTAIEGVNKRQGKSETDVGYTCRKGGKLNGGVVPLTIGRHAAVERRTVIGDLVYGMLHSARLAPGMHIGNKSYLKGYDERPYTWGLPPLLMTFLGLQYQGGGTNELERTNPAFSQCQGLQGENYSFQNKGDVLYISDVTHRPFTQEKVEASGQGGQQGINRYVQEWAEADKDGTEISKRGLDEKSQNYATSFRYFATCPSEYVRWEPPLDQHDAFTRLNLEIFCRQEYFGGLER